METAIFIITKPEKSNESYLLTSILKWILAIRAS